MVAGKKRATRGVGPIYRVTWCRMVFFSAAPVQCIASCIHGLPYTGGRVSSISDSPISVTPSLKYWAAEKQKPKILGLDPISGTRFWLSGPQIWTQWRHDFVFLKGDQRFVTIFVILRCHRFLCEDVAQIKEVSPGRQHICFFANFLKMKTHIFIIYLTY